MLWERENLITFKIYENMKKKLESETVFRKKTTKNQRGNRRRRRRKQPGSVQIITVQVHEHFQGGEEMDMRMTSQKEKCKAKSSSSSYFFSLRGCFDGVV